MKRALPAGASTASAGARGVEAQRPSLLDDERAARVVLPADHPEWRRDAVTLSSRARAFLAKLKPYAIRVLTFWDHRTTTLALDELTLEIDASGSYRAH